ncbi:hypothetical protein HDK90DRAFT_78328 [Phyllosticta capitalensis]|uniref:Uncharacterized protein n=1 Tax=Phyllosticta capitalensis TaxID=121624 RepID=A0ABR1YE08_9PEZI
MGRGVGRAVDRRWRSNTSGSTVRGTDAQLKFNVLSSGTSPVNRPRLWCRPSCGCSAFILIVGALSLVFPGSMARGGRARIAVRSRRPSGWNVTSSFSFQKRDSNGVCLCRMSAQILTMAVGHGVRPAQSWTEAMVWGEEKRVLRRKGARLGRWWRMRG